MESPTAGVGASERSMMPSSAPSICDASRAMSSPTRVILKVVRLMRSASSMNEASGLAATTLRTTPGPEMATLMLHSASPLPCIAPAMKGLSSGALQKMTILAQPMESCSAVRLLTASSTSAMRSTASMLMPARVEATLTDEQTRCVLADGVGDRLDEGGVAAREALLDQRAEAAEEVDADLVGGRVQRVRHLEVGLRVVAADDVGDRRDRDAPVDDGHAVLLLQLGGDLDQLAGAAHDLGVDALGRAARLAGGAVVEGDAHGDGPDVEVLGPDHAHGLEDLLGGDEDHSRAR